MNVQMGVWDLVVIVVYSLGILGIGCWAGLQRRQSAGRDYFLAGGTLTWPVIGLALFSTNISSIHLVSLAQEGYVNGLAYGNFEWMATFLLIVLALFFAPFYVRASVATLPDFLERRYNRACRDWLAVLSIVSAVFIHIGFSLYTGAVVIKSVFGIDIFWSIVLSAVFSAVYTIIGGLLAVAWTGAVQTVIMLAGSIAITLMGLHRVGGWEGLAATVEPVKLTVLRSADDPSQLPWYGVFLGYPVIGLWYWCADQTIVQRVLGAKDENHARVGALFAGFIKILPVFIFVLPGLIAAAIIQQNPDLTPLERSEDAYTFLIATLLPDGMRGLVIAALLAALMSTVAGALNSIATLFSYDLLQRIKPGVSDRTMVRTGQIVTFLFMVAAVLWSPYVGRFTSVFQGVSKMICYIAPPITAVFLWGVFTRRVSSVGALVTLIAGSGLGLGVFLLDWFGVLAGWQARCPVDISFMMLSFYLFLLCSGMLFVVSALAPRPLSEEASRLVWDNPVEALRGKAWRGIGDYRVLSVVLTGVMVVLYVIFR